MTKPSETPKIYDTGKGSWRHGQPCDFERGRAFHELLGPCPQCGTCTYDYGGWWACRAMYCARTPENTVCNNGPHPDWWNTDIDVRLDGNAWCATGAGFTNLQESTAGFGDTPQAAVDSLRAALASQEKP